MTYRDPADAARIAALEAENAELRRILRPTRKVEPCTTCQWFSKDEVGLPVCNGQPGLDSDPSGTGTRDVIMLRRDGEACPSWMAKPKVTTRNESTATIAVAYSLVVPAKPTLWQRVAAFCAGYFLSRRKISPPSA